MCKKADGKTRKQRGERLKSWKQLFTWPEVFKIADDLFFYEQAQEIMNAKHC